MVNTNVYDESFYREISGGSGSSADVIVPLVLELVEPRSVVDVGCGIGMWLAAFKKHGVTKVLGIDGAWVNPDWLRIDRSEFRQQDLTEPVTLSERFDLVVSLEVAEHIPSEKAEAFIASLTRLGSVVMFSAAVPFQGGDSHVNEQWPEYWQALFAKHGFQLIDCIRKQVWHNPQVEFWYAQNCFLFATPESIANNPRLQKALSEGVPERLAIVHPANYLNKTNHRWLRQAGFWPLLAALPGALERSLRQTLRRQK